VKTKWLCLFATAVGALILAGCTTTPSPDLPVEARGITLVAVSSWSVRVRPPFLRVREGHIEVAGSVAKVFGPGTTEHSHLDVSCFGDESRPLRTTEVEFFPRNLSGATSRSPAQSGSYSLALEPVPAGTVRIEVRAHDGEHSRAP